MARVTFLQTNFTAGEISPKLHGRVDIARYQNGAKEVRDLIPQVYGGVKTRPGTLFVREVKDSTKRVRLVPFVKDNSTAFVLEFGHLYVRFYKNGAVIESSPGVPYEVVSPYTEAQVQVLDYTQGADTMFLFHEAVAPYKLVRTSDTNWTLAAVSFVTTPFDENGSYPVAILTPGSASPVGSVVKMATGALTGTIGANVSLTWAAGVVTANKVAHGLATGDAVAITEAVPAGYNQSVAIVTAIDADNYSYAVSDNPGTATNAGKSQKYAGTAIFAAGDIGKTVKINGGLVKITTVDSSSSVRGVIKQELTAAVSSQPDAWSLHAPVWTAGNGYPRTGTLFEQRLICAGSPVYPQTIWGSVTGAYLDFQQGTADDDAFAFTISSDVMNPIEFMASNKAMLALTSGGEFTVQGGVEKPITPTNAQIKQRSNYGCSRVRPVRIRDSELFVQRAGRKVRSFGYSVANDDWMGPDLSVLAEHLTQGDIIDMCWQQEPDSIVWLARGDGALVSITLDKEQEVTAWAWHEGFSGIVETMTSIPADGGDEVWMGVRRTIGGATKRYLERLSDTTALDCAIVATGASSATWSGLTHLNGETVKAVADDAYAGEHTVAGGSVTLAAAATEVNIGLAFTPTLVLLPPEIQTGMGASSGNAMRTSELTVRFHETTGCSINGKSISFHSTGSAALQAPEPFTGIKRVEQLGFERGTDEITLTQEQPMPFHVLSVTRKFTVNEG
jgi:hypothetical protein